MIDLLSPAYPPELEAYWLEQAMAETHARSDRDAIQRLLPDIRRLADRFTTERPGLAAKSADPGKQTAKPSESEAPSVRSPTQDAGPGSATATAGEPSVAPYLRNARHAIAYALYFAPLTHARVNLVLPELPLRAPDERRPYRILDLGSGTGAAAWPVLARAAAAGHAALSLDACDTSRAALRALHQSFTFLRPDAFSRALLRTHSEPAQNLDLPRGAYDLVLIHYVLNELSPATQRAVLARAATLLAPDGVLLVCEPLVRAAGDLLQAWRSYALGDLKLHILAPCPHESDCPLHEPCHAVRTFPPTRTLQILATALHRDLRHLAFTFLALAKTPRPAPDGITPARLVASPIFAKGQTVCPCCLPDASYARVQVLHRGLDAAAKKSLRGLERGQRLDLCDIAPLGSQRHFRACPAP